MDSALDDIDQFLQDDIDQLLQVWEGDARSLLAALLYERRQLIRQLELTSSAMSFGFVRGWKAEIPLD